MAGDLPVKQKDPSLLLPFASSFLLRLTFQSSRLMLRESCEGKASLSKALERETVAESLLPAGKLRRRPRALGMKLVVLSGEAR
ncbi:MAG: hypothetical protein DDT20_01068 [Firmicutes bacterium]|nr:hypothetical protein [Bacillota bacterium]